MVDLGISYIDAWQKSTISKLRIEYSIRYPHKAPRDTPSPPLLSGRGFKQLRIKANSDDCQLTAFSYLVVISSPRPLYYE